jgi:N-formylglutamate amidohydrolase
MALRAKHGYALLWDAHSIPSVVPRLFEGELPQLNLGSNASKSCSRTIEDAVASVAKASAYSTAVNGRFKGGYITRHYGSPQDNIHALQLEIAQRAYMNEASTRFDKVLADDLRDILQSMLQSFLRAAKS